MGRRAILLAINRSLIVLLPLLILYVTIRVSNAATYGSIALGQSIGTIGSIIIDYGWGNTGPVTVAQADRDSRASLYAESVGARCWFSLPALLIVFVLVATLRPGILTELSAFSATLVGFSSAWYFIGIGDGSSLIWYDTVPRVVATVVGILVSIATAEIGWLLLLQAVGALVAPIIATRSIVGVWKMKSSSFRLSVARRVARSQFQSAVTSATTGLYVTLPVTLIAAVNAPAVETFAAVQRIERLSLALARPLKELLQSWAPSERDSKQLIKKIRQSIWLGITASLVLAFVVCLTTRPLVGILTAHTIEVSWWSAIFMGVTVGAISASQITGLVCLPAIGLFRKVLNSTMIGATIGVCAVPALGYVLGAPGAWAGLALAETIVLVYQLRSLRRALRRGSPVTVPTGDSV